MIRMSLYIVAGLIGMVGLALVLTVLAAANRYGTLAAILGALPALWGTTLLIAALFVAGFARIIELLELIQEGIDGSPKGAPTARYEPNLPTRKGN